ncbi:DsbA family protein [Streptomyces sp. SPB074]|uniref:DsbA family protein n=1 Tax=Streptomyces sp. (strain SPB074) TaxID=465543 RepID=UPI00055DC46B|nr:thioredoxin domain-containing protein [Streptomyces sp. SPB074]
MSEKNRQGKLSARDRIAADRRREEAREKRRKSLVMGAVVLGVLVVVGGVGAAVTMGKKDGADAAGPVVAPKGATGEDGLAIPLGEKSAPSVLTIWEDFRCPACAQFENGFRSTVHELADAGKLRVEYHLATLIDGNMGGSGSASAANAALCAQDVGKFPAYHDVLYANQPAETTDPYAQPDKLIDLAKKVKGLDTPAFRSCVEDKTHSSWVSKSNEKFQQGGFRGTPTVLLDGKDVFKNPKPAFTPDRLKELVEEKAAKG